VKNNAIDKIYLMLNGNQSKIHGNGNNELFAPSNCKQRKHNDKPFPHVKLKEKTSYPMDVK